MFVKTGPGNNAHVSVTESTFTSNTVAAGGNLATGGGMCCDVLFCFVCLFVCFGRMRYRRIATCFDCVLFLL